jgi:tRNA pseudouridine38-40 synthase
MTAAATALLGERDFSAFRAAQCQSTTPMRHMFRIAVERSPGRVVLRFRANAFLYHMVRNLVGVLTAIGRGEAGPSWAAQLLAGRDRRAGAATAPPQGLCLTTVAYAAEFGLPNIAA